MALFDPLLYRRDVPLKASFYPSGFPLAIETDSPRVIEAAEESWAACFQQFQTPPLRLRVFVDPGGTTPPEPLFRGFEQLVAIASDRSNFAMCSSAGGYGYCSVTEAAVRDLDWFRYHFLEAAVYLLLAQLHLAPVHAACVSRSGCGVLLCGVSGAGKSCLAYACAGRGWTYVADDAAALLRRSKDPVVTGRPHQIRFRPGAGVLFPELEGRLASVHPNGKPTIEVRTADIPGISVASCARVRSIAFLNRAPAESRPRFTPVHAEQALARLESDLPLIGEEAYRDQRRCLRNLFERGVTACDLHYADPFAAADAMEALLCEP